MNVDHIIQLIQFNDFDVFVDYITWFIQSYEFEACVVLALGFLCGVHVVELWAIWKENRK